MGGVLLNNRYLLYFTAAIFTVLLIAQSGVAAETNADGYTNINVEEANKMIKGCSNVFILDVRTPAEYHAAHLKGAHLIPYKNVIKHDPIELPEYLLLPARISEVPMNKPVIVYCLTGGRSTSASNLLAENGYKNIYNMNEAIPAWINAKYPVVSTFVDESGVKGPVKKELRTQINCALSYLETGNEAKAKEQLDKFKSFVNDIETACLITTDQAKYLRAEADQLVIIIDK